ncbi:MAG TPA: hypothetical protein DIS76_07625 [Rhodospirillaceae bacterium]|nr:hypothetical protein [Rhodospirillaceae bacterium]
MQRRAVFQPRFVSQANTGGPQSGGATKAASPAKTEPSKTEPKATVVAEPPKQPGSVMSSIWDMYNG